MKTIGFAATLIVCFVVFPTANQGLTAAEKPNILFLLTEDQGYHLGAIGTPGLKTPHMDSIVQAGMLFREAFVAYPVCSASKAAIYTGLHNHTNGVLNNTVNYFKPASEVTEEEKAHPLYRTNRIRDQFPTLTELLQQQGYYQGVTGKLHILPNRKFPYEEFIPRRSNGLLRFMQNAEKAGKPWFLLHTISAPHRPFPNSDVTEIFVSPDEVDVPKFLPDTPVVRKDWAEYLAHIENADGRIGEALAALRQSGQESNTLVIFMGDHGPAIQHGKMTMYDLGLRVPLAIKGAGVSPGSVSDELVSEMDLLPTILDWIGADIPGNLHGHSIRPILEGASNATGHDYVFAEISNRGPLPNDGMQERSIYDGQYRLIYRERVDAAWRQVQADARDWERWRNRSYDETIRVRKQFPEQYRVLAEMDPQNLGGKTPRLELYDVKNDPDEMQNLVGNVEFDEPLLRLYNELKAWTVRTADPAVTMPAEPPVD